MELRWVSASQGQNLERDPLLDPDCASENFGLFYDSHSLVFCQTMTVYRQLERLGVQKRMISALKLYILTVNIRRRVKEIQLQWASDPTLNHGQ